MTGGFAWCEEWIWEPGFAGATPQDLLRDFPESPKGVQLL